MANIVTWQERGINLLATKNASKDILNVLTKVHFVQFATFQQPEHKCQILGREVTSSRKRPKMSQRPYFLSLKISLIQADCHRKQVLIVRSTRFHCFE